MSSIQERNISEKAEDLLSILERVPVYNGANEDVLVSWKITGLTMWQQTDRRLDECVILTSFCAAILAHFIVSVLFSLRVNELLWTFQRSGCDRADQMGQRDATVLLQISRRSVRLERADELKVFHEWADRMYAHRYLFLLVLTIEHLDRRMTTQSTAMK